MSLTNLLPRLRLTTSEPRLSTDVSRVATVVVQSPAFGVCLHCSAYRQLLRCFALSVCDFESCLFASLSVVVCQTVFCDNFRTSIACTAAICDNGFVAHFISCMQIAKSVLLQLHSRMQLAVSIIVARFFHAFLSAVSLPHVCCLRTVFFCALFLFTHFCGCTFGMHTM